MTNVQVAHDLNTEEGFERRVSINRTPRTVALALVAVTAVAIIYNTISTLRTLADFGGRPSDFLVVFFSTTGDSPISSVLFFVLVWAPPFLLPASLAFYLYSRLTASTVAARTFQEFQSRGYVATQAATGIRVSPGNDRNLVPVVLLTHPTVSGDAFASALTTIEEHRATLDKKATKALGRSLVAGGVATGTPASAISGDIPSALLLALPKKGSTDVLVIPPPFGSTAKRRIFGVKA